MTQPPKVGFARDIWLTCPECGGTLDDHPGGMVCEDCDYTKQGER